MFEKRLVRIVAYSLSIIAVVTYLELTNFQFFLEKPEEQSLLAYMSMLLLLVPILTVAATVNDLAKKKIAKDAIAVCINSDQMLGQSSCGGTHTVQGKFLSRGVMIYNTALYAGAIKEVLDNLYTPLKFRLSPYVVVVGGTKFSKYEAAAIRQAFSEAGVKYITMADNGINLETFIKQNPRPIK